MRPMTGNVEALSEREKETLRLLLQGHGSKSIAGQLGLSVHTVNERLRNSRRKLDVSNSREAARLLAQSEQISPNSFVDKQIRVASDGMHGNKDPHGKGRKGVKHPIVLAIGGTLIMSLIIAAAILASSVSGDREAGPLQNWSTAGAVPGSAERVTNSIRLDGNRLLWNGEPTPEATIRQFLAMTTQMKPQPQVILSYSAETPPERVQQARLLIEEIVQCKPHTCLEITLAALVAGSLDPNAEKMVSQAPPGTVLVAPRKLFAAAMPEIKKCGFQKLSVVAAKEPQAQRVPSDFLVAAPHSVTKPAMECMYAALRRSKSFPPQLLEALRH